VKHPFRRILVPFDFSAQSRRALEVAFELVPASGEIIVLKAIPPVTSLAGIRPPGGPVWFPPKDLLAATQQKMEAIAEAAASGHPGSKVRCRVAVGEPLPEILAAARRANLIVMATTGRSALSHVMLGSIAERVVRQAPVPVLTIGQQAGRRMRRSAAVGSRRRGDGRAARKRNR